MADQKNESDEESNDAKKIIPETALNNQLPQSKNGSDTTLIMANNNYNLKRVRPYDQDPKIED